MNELTAGPPGPPAFGAVPGHPQLISDAPVFAGMLLEQPWAEAAGFMRGRVDIRIGGTDGEQAPRPPRAIEPTAVHDPPRLAIEAVVQSRPRGRRAVAVQ